MTESTINFDVITKSFTKQNRGIPELYLLAAIALGSFALHFAYKAGWQKSAINAINVINDLNKEN